MRKVVLLVLGVCIAAAVSGETLRVPRRKPLTARVGIVGVGHHTYWGQFPGLLDVMNKKLDTFETMVKTNEVETFRFGLLDKAADAYAALPKMKAADLDLLFVDMVTYATSSTFAVLARDLNVPIVLVALQPRRAMPYETAQTRIQLENDDICAVPEFADVAIRLGHPVQDVVIGTLADDPDAERGVAEWCGIAHVLHDLKRARIGAVGHVMEAMYDLHVDPTAVTAAFGCHVALCEPDEIVAFYGAADADAVEAKKKEILGFFDTPEPVSDPITEKLTPRDLEVAAKAAVALDRFTAARQLDGLAYYYEGTEGSETREVMSNLIVGNSLLTAAGFPMCGEFDIKNCIAMLIFDRLGIGGSFAEFHPVDFDRGTVLVGHDGPHHLNIAAGRPVLRSLKKYHGKPGSGAGVEFTIQNGPITMMSIGVKADGHFKFIIAEGESVAGPTPPTGNTNTHGLFRPDVRTFLRRWSMEGPTHHFALGIGHHADELVKLAKALGIEAVVVTDAKDAQ